MNLDDFKGEWRLEGAREENGGREAVLGEARHRAVAFERMIRRRDRAEVGTAALVCLFFLSQFGAAGMVTRVGIVVAVAAALLITVMLHRARRRAGRVDPGAPLAEWTRAERDRVAAQIRLLRTVLWWYVLPLGVGVVLVFGGAAGWGLATALYSAAVVLLGVFVYHLNQRAVRKDLVPRYQELDNLVRQLEEEGP